ncbi:MAG: PAS domain S-box protein [Candidatus Hodarchaeales archaeon]
MISEVNNENMSKEDVDSKDDIIRILHVDNDENFLNLTKIYLKQLSGGSLNVVSITDPKRVLSKIKENIYDCIVSDYQMPDMNGLELLKTLRNVGKDIPFIIFTGRGREEVAIEALNLGADYYIKKGGDPKSQFKELEHVIRRVYRHKQMEEALRDSEKKYHALFESANDAIIICNLKEIIDCNQKTLELFHCSREQVIGQVLHRFAPLEQPDGIESVKKADELLRRAFAGETLDIEWIGYRFDDTSFYAEITLNPIEISGEKYIQCTMKDVTEHKNAENKLRESEQKFRKLAESTVAGIVIIQDDKIKYVNEAVSCIVGYQREELEKWSQRDLYNVIHPDDLHLIVEQMQKKQTGETDCIIPCYSCRLFTVSGDIKWVNVYTKTIIFGGKPADLVTLIDFTDRKLIEEELAKSERFNRKLVEYSPSGIMFIDTDGILTYENPAMEKMIGIPKGKESPVLGLEIAVIPNGTLSLLKRAYAGEKIAGEVVHYHSLMGKEINLELNGGLVEDEKGMSEGMILMVNDVTDRKQAEEDLKRSEQKFRKIVEESRMGILLTDEKGIILEWNRAQEHITGMRAVDAIGRPIWDVLYVLTIDDRKTSQLYEVMTTVYKEYLSKLQDDPVSNKVPQINKIKRTDGKLRVLKNDLFQIETRKGYMICNISEDITERKNAEVKLKKQKEELSDFAHFIVHDIMNSLFIIDSHAQFLEEEYDKIYVDKLLKQTEYLNILLRKSLLLADAGLIVERIDRVNLNMLVDMIADMVVPPHIIFSHDELPEIICDNDKFHQIMKNLIENAVNHGSPSEIRVMIKETDSGKNLQIANNGKMIPLDVQKRIFDRGYSTSTGSTGLGLTIVKKLVEAHGWEISVQSSLKSTIFQILIPTEKTG